MNKIKFLILSLIIVLVIIVAGLIVLRSQINNNIEENDTTMNQTEERQDKLIELNQYSAKENNTYTIFALDDLIQKSFNKGLSNNEENIEYHIQDVYYLQTYDKAEYYTYGLKVRDKSEVAEDCYLKVSIDYENNIYEIKSLEKEKYVNAKEGKVNKIEEIDIMKDTGNKYSVEFLSTDKIIEKYIKDFTFKIKYAPEKAYELLDEEYKNKKFKNIEEFIIYSKEQKERFENTNINECGKDIEESYLKYYATDANDYYYQINAYLGLNYKIILDSYTIETEESIEKYNSYKKEKQVTECIYKYLKILKEKDYQYAYSFLDETFKSQNYDTLTKFEQYMNQNIIKYSTVKINEISKVGDVYSCNVTLKTSENEEDDIIKTENINIIILLQENSDFVVSFSLNK